jgi:hypothetical protein
MVGYKRIEARFGVKVLQRKKFVQRLQIVGLVAGPMGSLRRADRAEPH